MECLDNNPGKPENCLSLRDKMFECGKSGFKKANTDVDYSYWSKITDINSTNKHLLSLKYLRLLKFQIMKSKINVLLNHHWIYFLYSSSDRVFSGSLSYFTSKSQATSDCSLTRVGVSSTCLLTLMIYPPMGEYTSAANLTLSITKGLWPTSTLVPTLGNSIWMIYPSCSWA